MCIRDSRIAVHQFRQLVDILDDALGPHIARRGFCSEPVDGGREIRAGDAPLLQAIVCVQNGKSVQKLALILMPVSYTHLRSAIRRPVDRRGNIIEHFFTARPLRAVAPVEIADSRVRLLPFTHHPVSYTNLRSSRR